MKPKILFFFLITIFDVYGQTTSPAQYNIELKNSTVLKVSDDIASIQSNDKLEFYQYSLKSNKLILSFKLSNELVQEIYSAFFGGEGISKLENVSKVLNSYNQYQRVVKIHSYFIDTDNTPYAFVSGLQAIPDTTESNSANPPNYRIVSFYSIMELKQYPNAVNIFPVTDVKIGEDYFINELGSFFRKGNNFYLTMEKMGELTKDNMFIGEFHLSKNKLFPFQMISDFKIPSYHIRSKFGANMLSSIVKSDYLMLYTSNELQGVNHASKVLLVEQLANIDPSNQGFNIAYTTCDFFLTSNGVIQLIYRFNNSFYLAQFDKSLAPLGYKKIEEYVVKDLQRFPLFSNKGEVVFQLKNNERVSLITKEVSKE